MGKLYLLLISFTSLLACPLKKLSPDYIIKNVSVIDTASNGDVSIQDIAIKDGIIQNISEVRATDETLIMDGTGKYLMPGLTEMHAHIPTPNEGDDSIVKETLFLYLSQGVTTIRGMLGDPYHLKLKEMIANDEILSPRVYTSSPSLNGGTIKTKEEAIEKVSQYQKDGYDFLKIHPGITLDVWNSVEETAKKVGIPYAGHVPVEVGIHRALEAGYGTVDHLDGYLDGLIPEDVEYDINGGGFFAYGFIDKIDLSLLPELVKKTKALDVAVVPTQTLFTRWFSPTDPAINLQEPEMKYMPSKTRFSWRQNKERMIGDDAYSVDNWNKYISIRKEVLREMNKQGVSFLLGSDAPQVMNVPGFSIHHEMKTMSDAGISNAKILHSGTANPAQFFNAEDEYGTITPGASADLILLRANPLEDISHSSEIEAVMVRGTLLSREMIDKRLAEIAVKHE